MSDYLNDTDFTTLPCYAQQQRPRWIPTADKLPNANMQVFVTVRNDAFLCGFGVLVAEYDSYTGKFYYPDSDPDDYDPGLIEGVIAWMPYFEVLPEPWKGGEQGV